jgi:hypothetical protein
MYNTEFLCTYKLHDDDDHQDTLYRHEYLYAFGLKEYDSDKIMKTLEYIYNKLEDNVDFIEILESHYHFKSDSNNNKNHELVLPFLFSFHTFHLFHNCLTYLLSFDMTYMKNANAMVDTDIYNLTRETFIKNKKLLIDEISKK